MMKSLVEAAIKQRLVVCVIAVVLFFFGLRAATKLSVDAFPDVTNVQVQIATEAAGRSPEEVERFVTVPVEMAMTGLPGLEEMRSLNKAGLSLITLVFTDATDVYFARQLVMERLIEVGGRMPEGVSPVLGPVSTGLGEVYQYTLDRADDGNRELTQEELAERRIAQDWVVRPLLRSIPGVAEINSQGGYVRQYQALVNPERMRHYQISTQQVYEALARNNANSGGGVLPHYAEQYLIRGVGLARGVDDLGSIVLKEINGTPVYLRDVANVTIGHEVRQGALVKNGQTEAVGGIVMMMRGGNAKEVVSRVKARVAEINERGMLPGKLQIVPYYDRSELVDSALWTVTKVLLEGVVLVVIVLFLFLGDVRSSLIVLATLVLTPLLTFMVMNEVGLSANLMSLGGLAIAIGLMVDGSVVVVENAFERLGHKEPGLTKTEILVKAVQEVATPVIVGVGIIILVFLPLMTLSGMEGKMFAPLAFTISIALAISLFLSLTLSPVLSSYLLKGGAEHDTHVIAFMKRHYLRLLHWALGNSRKTVLCAVAAFVATLAIVPLLGTSFIPEMKEGSIVPAIDRVPNISLEESIKLEKEANKLVLSVPGVKSVVSGVGRGESPADPQGQNESTPIASLKDRDEWPDGWTQDDIANAIRDKLKAIPGVQIVMAQPISDRVDEMVSGVRSDVAVKVFGDDLDKLRELAGEIARVAGGIQGSQDIRIERVSGQQYLSIEIDRQAIARYGLNVSDIHDVIEIAIGGKRATDIFEGERRFAAAVRLPEEFRNNEQAIRQLLVSTPNGTQVPLQSVARIEVNDGPAQISREMAKRRVVVMINVKDRDLGGFVAELQQATGAKVKLPEGYYLEWGGQFQNMERAMGHLKIIVPVTIAAIFFLLFLLFNSLRFATLIITVLPFASIGGIIGLFVTGEYLSVPASVGFIALWGMAVLNGVVLVSYIRTLRDSGLSVDEAVVQGATQRFRPVMMTATIAMLGLVPFLFSTGPGSEVQRPLAVVVIGGLITSTLLTLVMVPTLYRWFDDRRPDPTRDVPV
ncbi:cobalt-zinc-cadmium resistance efflux pump CzcB [Cupriavidus necator N-1]|jgi:cobalt-zinc-cadmium resistance protein CzcA|uniref:Cobalt-zinc-cadmium resistance efflux pump CzcB n=1 Tax=Cupriavidus necator (strain ATCC 43291 / DSM 13513 / CCUG 52238 / LMG 8453 / N-1) TaxID=1042878 RepID=F8GQT1_CUPNN|nr:MULTISPECIES: efflux RND transporter permease subunit [Cupriavidus]AEI80757.1 cobalt-zinc-cadmium resistance efflux pump CzcB [Cupriavidus necator N-1]KAI3595747.1 CzcABC family efflux RND transporter, transmembrane protein [Cupriavidus necator H850]MDX6009616.1 efflux RND transporter permease subunit [Cupriavidus necator]QUN30973.1 efflux RND transporter permease subunit [Cupriavidus sp. KK10]